MKVTTEGCVFGAIIELEGSESRILDIGTGTGLLSLMLAQRSGAEVTALEVDEASASQAAENFRKSPWGNRMQVVHTSLQAYAVRNTQEFDLIVSNPPYFANHLKSGKSKDLAIHDDLLPQDDLIHGVVRLLSPQGRFWVIYPDYQFETLQDLALTQNLHVTHDISLLNRANTPPLRRIGCYQFDPGKAMSSSLTIRTETNQYSTEFLDKVKDFYL